MTVTWGIGFAVVGALFVLVASEFGVFRTAPGSHMTLASFAGTVRRWGVVGAASGAVFALIVMLRGQRATFATLSVRRFALWGAAGGTLGSVLMIPRAALGAIPAFTILKLLAAFTVIFGTIGGAVAFATLRAARGRSGKLKSEEAAALPPAT